MSKMKTVTVARGDLLAAWAVLENLAVSLDQIGGTYPRADKNSNGQGNERACQRALIGYLQPELVRAIKGARARLGQYLSDADAEKTAAQIPYWDYQSIRTGRKRKS